MDWQPIDTAPRDYTEILVYDPEHECFVAWYEYHRHEWRWSPHDAGWCNPTHWMPLPPPPTEKARSE